MKERIRELLDVLNIPQHQFASDVGTDQGTISKYISGKNRPTRAICKSIIYQYSVNPEWLYYGKGPMFLYELDEKKVLLIKRIKNMNENELDLLENFIKYLENTNKKIENISKKDGAI